MVDAIEQTSPAKASAIHPRHPQPALNLAVAQLDIGAGAAPSAARHTAFRAFSQAPLSEEPFLIAGVDALAAGPTEHGERLLEEARRRNPRLRQVRLLLLERYLRTNKLEEAGRELSSLGRLVPEVVDALAPQFARMIRDERTGASLIRVLGDDPALQEAVLTNLASTGADPALILRIARSAPEMAPTHEGLPWQRQLVASLAKRGDLPEALRLWRKFAGMGPGSDEKAVYDGLFQNLPGSSPFNWEFYVGSSGIAERTRSPALNVQFFGRESVHLASQLMVLRPGRYRLSFRADGNASGDDSRLAWRVFCRANETQPLVDLPLRDISAAPRKLAAEFTVRAGCNGQWLRLTGIAGEFPETQTATIADVAVERTGRR
jgi:hypothetical protein